MRKILSRHLSVILEDADVLEPWIALQVVNASRHQLEELRDLQVAGVPQVTIVFRALYQHLVRTHVAHAIVDAVAAALRITFYAIQGRRMHNGPRRPRSSIKRGRGTHHLG